jgi:hypothetical protein
MRWIVLLLVAFAPPAAPTQTSLDQEGVNKLVQQLSSPSQQDREQAETELAAASPDVLDLLPRTTRDQTASIALERVRRSLEKSAARRAGLASTVSLEGQQSPEDIEAAILKQSGQAVIFGEVRPSTAIPVDWKTVPFWDAVRQLERQTNSSATPDRFAEALLLKRREENAQPPAVATSGSCRVEVIEALRRPNLVDPSKSLVQVRWRVRTEPRLRPLYLITADRDASLTEGATRFLPLSPDARREVPCERWDGCEVDTAFQTTADFKASKLKFSADATLKVAALPLKLRFPNLRSELLPPQRRGAVTGVIQSLEADYESKTLALEVSVAYDRGGPEFESHRMWIYQNAGWLEQNSGSRIVPPDSVELKKTAASGATLRYTFENVAGPVADWAFVYEAPSLIIDVPVSVKDMEISINK